MLMFDVNICVLYRVKWDIVGVLLWVLVFRFRQRIAATVLDVERSSELARCVLTGRPFVTVAVCHIYTCGMKLRGRFFKLRVNG